MRIYSDFALRRTFEIVGDLVAIAVLVAGVIVAVALHGAIASLGAVGVSLADAGRGIADPMNAIATGITSDGVGIFDDFLAPPFQAAAGGGETLVDAGTRFQSGVETVATIVGWVVAATIVLIVLFGWIGPRVYGAVRRSRLARLAASAGTRDLLAFRALANRPPRALARIDDPVGGWRTGHAPTLDALAALELRAGGVRLRPRRPVGE